MYTFFQIFFLNNAVDPNRISGLFGEELIQGSYFIRMLPIFLGLIYLTNETKSKNKILLTSIFIGVFIILLSGKDQAQQVYLYFFFLHYYFFH